MTWDPEGLVVGEAFADYVEELRETDNYAAGGGKPNFSDTMATTHDDEDAQVEPTAADPLDSSMSRRAFATSVGIAVATAAGAGSVSAQEGGVVPDFDAEFTPVPRIVDGRWSIDEHTADMDQLDYVDNDGEVRSLTSDYGAVLAPGPEDDDETHNPVSFHASYIDTSEYTDFPRGVTRDAAGDDEEEDVSALDAEEWTGDLAVSDDGDALVLEGGPGESATFSLADHDATIDSGEARKVLQLVVDVDTLEAGATVDVEVVDASGSSVVATIDPNGDEAADDVIATAQGSGVVFQTEIGALDGGSELDTLSEIIVTVADANADLTVHGLNLELDSEWSFGTREVLDEDGETVEETLVEPTGRTGIVSLPTLTNQFTDATIYELEYDLEVHASEAPTDNFEVTVEDVERGSYDERYHLVGALELPGGLYEVEVVEPGELVDEVRHPSDVYRTMEYAHDLTGIPSMEDLDDISWTDATSVLEDGDLDDEVTLSTTVSAGDTIGLHYDLTEDSDIVSSMSMSAGGGGAPALGGDGGFMTTIWGWGAAIVTGIVGAFALVRRRAASAAGR